MTRVSVPVGRQIRRDDQHDCTEPVTGIAAHRGRTATTTRRSMG
jgi:hypothetical protein